MNGEAVTAAESDPTVLDIVKRAAAFLAERGVENPRLDAELLLADLLELDRVGIYLNFD
ncbi:MAG: peptide chain release factor N(5)-glutamine methyltransferase, partial [Candidatus Binatia bacterium]